MPIAVMTVRTSVSGSREELAQSLQVGTNPVKD
jgi:hypothetical protein